jgi:RNA polymerase primary sigma factor
MGTGQQIRLPHTRYAVHRQIYKKRKQMEQELGRPVDVSEAIAEMGVNVTPWELHQYTSLHKLAYPWSPSEGELQDCGCGHPELEDRWDEEFWENVDIDSRIAMVYSLMQQICDERERDMITLYFWLDENQDHAWLMQEIGDKYSVSRERVRQILDRALLRIRKTYELHIMKEV